MLFVQFGRGWIPLNIFKGNKVLNGKRKKRQCLVLAGGAASLRRNSLTILTISNLYLTNGGAEARPKKLN